MREHNPRIKAGSMQKTASGIAFLVECEGYEESHHFERVAKYSPAELEAKVTAAIQQTGQNHEHRLAGDDHLESLLKKFADGIPNCAECG